MTDDNRTFRRPVLKTIGAGIVGGALVTGTVSAEERDLPGDAITQAGGAPPALIPPGFFPTWGSDGTDDWELTDTGPTFHEADPGDHPPEKPYDLIIPTYDSRSPHFGQHDQIVDTPPGNQGTYNANWYAHNIYYNGGSDGESHPDYGKPYNGLKVMDDSGVWLFDWLVWALDENFEEFDPGPGPEPEITPGMLNDVSPNDGDYLTTITEVREADFADRTSDPTDVPAECYGGPPGFFAGFTFVCPVRPITENGGGNNGGGGGNNG